MTWEQLAEIYRQNVVAAEQEANVPLVDCPYCGTALESGAAWLHCPMGDYTAEV
jgi:hypothetical protein